jgi:hypothetical protein
MTGQPPTKAGWVGGIEIGADYPEFQRTRLLISFFQADAFGSGSGTARLITTQAPRRQTSGVTPGSQNTRQCARLISTATPAKESCFAFRHVVPTRKLVTQLPPKYLVRVF